jgi:hypothetical protein
MGKGSKVDIPLLEMTDGEYTENSDLRLSH